MMHFKAGVTNKKPVEVYQWEGRRRQSDRVTFSRNRKSLNAHWHQFLFSSNFFFIIYDIYAYKCYKCKKT